MLLFHKSLHLIYDIAELIHLGTDLTNSLVLLGDGAILLVKLVCQTLNLLPRKKFRLIHTVFWVQGTKPPKARLSVGHSQFGVVVPKWIESRYFTHCQGSDIKIY
jgi:hypothetical protein